MWGGGGGEIKREKAEGSEGSPVVLGGGTPDLLDQVERGLVSPCL